MDLDHGCAAGNRWGGTAVYLKLPKEQAVPLVQDETLKVERGDVSEKLDTSGTVQASRK